MDRRAEAVAVHVASPVSCSRTYMNCLCKFDTSSKNHGRHAAERTGTYNILLCFANIVEGVYQNVPERIRMDNFFNECARGVCRNATERIQKKHFSRNVREGCVGTCWNV